ncbi:hypothetical protein H0H92_011549 [Tricholoma furcatifolium]|nr:hypothetical protein H0H92_011549 [Tricholoma furcatifolium]
MAKAKGNSKELPMEATERKRTTKKDRAVIRILSRYGMSTKMIADRIGFTTATVMNVVKPSVYSEDKISDDWNQVDDSFKEKYPPLALNFAKVRLEKHTKTRRTSHKSKTSDKTQEKAPDVKTMPITPPPKSTSQPSPPSLPLPRFEEMRQRLLQKKKQAESSEEAKRRRPDLKTFLASREHDLSDALELLEAQDIGTSEKFFALAHWPEERLCDMFRHAFPELTVPQQYMLVSGMKEYA